MCTFAYRGKPCLIRTVKHKRGRIGVVEFDCIAEVCGQFLVAHERLVRGKQIRRILEEAANPRLPRRVVVNEVTVSRAAIEAQPSLIDLAAETGMFASKGEIRRELKQNSIMVNKQKVGEDCRLTTSDILSCGCILIQKGKKNYYLVNIE